MPLIHNPDDDDYEFDDHDDQLRIVPNTQIHIKIVELDKTITELENGSKYWYGRAWDYDQQKNLEIRLTPTLANQISIKVLHISIPDELSPDQLNKLFAKQLWITTNRNTTGRGNFYTIRVAEAKEETINTLPTGVPSFPPTAPVILNAVPIEQEIKILEERKAELVRIQEQKRLEERRDQLRREVEELERLLKPQ